MEKEIKSFDALFQYLLRLEISYDDAFNIIKQIQEFAINRTFVIQQIKEMKQWLINYAVPSNEKELAWEGFDELLERLEK